MSKTTDETIMAIGKYKGRKMIDVPDDYLKWYWKEFNFHLRTKGRYPHSVSILEYIKESFNENELQ